METALLSAAQFALAIVFSALAAYLGVWLFDRTTPHVDEWTLLKQGNVAVGLVLGAIVLGVAIVLRPALQVNTALRPDAGAVWGGVLLLGLQAIQVIIGLIFAVVAIALALWIFTRLTGDLDEWAEIVRGNAAVGIMLSGVILSAALISGVALDAILKLITG
jgi:uncharacterized membrane protein YjfL (UPF0719 family)